MYVYQAGRIGLDGVSGSELVCIHARHLDFKPAVGSVLRWMLAALAPRAERLDDHRPDAWSGWTLDDADGDARAGWDLIHRDWGARTAATPDQCRTETGPIHDR